jgi:hypothetical protein
MRRATSARARQAWSALVLQTGPAGLCIQVSDPEVSIEYREPGSFADERILLSANALDDFQGAHDALVELEATATAAGAGVARWDDSGVPQVREYRLVDPENVPAFPATSDSLVPVEAGFLKALHDASMTAAREDIRYALRRLQLRGTAGEIIATDGRQFLMQGGFSFPWKEDVLVTAVGIFGGREIPWDAPVVIGRTESHLVLRADRWTIYLAIDAAGRYPDARCIIPSLTRACTIWKLKPEAGAFLAKALPRLPGGIGGDSPITVDLNGHAAIRAKAEGQGRLTELALEGTEIVGPPVRFCFDRHYLTRALHLGFTEVQVINPDQPIVCRDERRVYIWNSLPKGDALAPAEDSLPLASDGKLSDPSDPCLERKESIMHIPTTNATSPQPEQTVEKNDSSSLKQPGINGLIAEAEALKTAVHEIYDRASRLAAGLKRHRKQSKLMATTLASLRQLQNIAD